MSESNIGKTRLTTPQALPSGGNEHTEKPTGLAALSGARAVPAHTPARVDVEHRTKVSDVQRGLAGLVKGSLMQSSNAKASDLMTYLPDEAKTVECLENLKLAFEARGEDVSSLLHVDKNELTSSALRMQIRIEMLEVLARNGDVDKALDHKEYLLAREAAVGALTSVVKGKMMGRSARDKAITIISKLGEQFYDARGMRDIRGVIEGNPRTDIVSLLRHEKGDGLSVAQRDTMRVLAIKSLIDGLSIADAESNVSCCKQIMKVENFVIDVLGESDGRQLISDLREEYGSNPDVWSALERQLLTRKKDVAVVVQELQRYFVGDAELRRALFFDYAEIIANGHSIDTAESRILLAAECTQKIADLIEGTVYECSGKPLKAIYDALDNDNISPEQRERMLGKALAEKSLCKEYLALRHETGQLTQITDDERARHVLDAAAFFSVVPTPSILKPTTLVDGQKAPKSNKGGRPFTPAVLDYQYQRNTTAAKVATVLNQAIIGTVDLRVAGLGASQYATGYEMLLATNVANSQCTIIFNKGKNGANRAMIFNDHGPLSGDITDLERSPQSHPAVYSVNWVRAEPTGINAERIAQSNRRAELMLRKVAYTLRAQRCNIIDHSNTPVTGGKNADSNGQGPQPLSIIVDVKNAVISVMPVDSHYSTSIYRSAVAPLPKDQAEFDEWRNKPSLRPPDIDLAEMTMRPARARQAQAAQGSGALNEARRPNDNVQDAPFLAPPVLNKRSTGNMSTVVPETVMHAPDRNTHIQEEAPEDTMLTPDELRALNIAPPPRRNRTSDVDEAPSQASERKKKSDFIFTETEL